jgi:hypothetical protein
MRRLLPVSILALVALAALAGSASAATPRSVINSFSPAQVAVNGVLVLRGKNFASGTKNNRVFFTRATDGKTVRARPRKATKTRIEVVVPSAITKFLATNATGGKKATRFQVAVFTKLLGKYTAKSRSPIILPAGTAPIPTGGGALPPGATAADCDGDGTPNTTDTDDDNDLLADPTEAQLGTDPCKADSDGDGISDGYEYYSALDLNGNNLPYPGTKPYPNPLDASDAGTDFDRDGLTDGEEFAAWAKFGGASLPLSYSAGNANTGGSFDGTKDADGDGLNNVQELAKGGGDPFNPARIATPGLFHLDWLNPDTDGDTIPDGADDQDHDGLSNIEEVTSGDDGRTTDPEDPTSGSTDCDGDGIPNATDGDDDNDGLSDATERSLGTSPCNKDTDGDGLEDGWEQASALDLNGTATPYPGKRAFPNALDGGDGGTDYDRDGLPDNVEFALWIVSGGHSFPLNYSGGDQTSGPAQTPGAGQAYLDLNSDGVLTDDEKDADGDGLGNYMELAQPDGSPTIYTGGKANGTTFNPGRLPEYSFLIQLDPASADSDGDGINDGADDNDHDGVSNKDEVVGTTDPEDTCDPNPNSPYCPLH